MSAVLAVGSAWSSLRASPANAASSNTLEWFPMLRSGGPSAPVAPRRADLANHYISTVWSSDDFVATMLHLCRTHVQLEIESCLRFLKTHSERSSTNGMRGDTAQSVSAPCTSERLANKRTAHARCTNQTCHSSHTAPFWTFTEPILPCLTVDVCTLLFFATLSLCCRDQC